MIVARSTTQHGGQCDRRGCAIRPGEVIVKIDTGRRGGSTRRGQGLGEWWCEPCAAELDPDDTPT